VPGLESLQDGRQSLHDRFHLERKVSVEAATVKCAFQFDAGVGQVERLDGTQGAGQRMQALAKTVGVALGQGGVDTLQVLLHAADEQRAHLLR